MHFSDGHARIQRSSLICCYPLLSWWITWTVAAHLYNSFQAIGIAASVPSTSINITKFRSWMNSDCGWCGSPSSRLRGACAYGFVCATWTRGAASRTAGFSPCGLGSFLSIGSSLIGGGGSCSRSLECFYTVIWVPHFRCQYRRVPLRDSFILENFINVSYMKYVIFLSLLNRFYLFYLF